MPLRVVIRKDTGALTISGRLKLTSGETIRVRERAQSNDRRVAEEEAKSLELKILRDDWLGKRPASRSFAEAVKAYTEATPRSNDTPKRLHRLLNAIGDVNLADVEDKLNGARETMLRPGAGAAAWKRAVIVPVRAVMRYAARRKWCDYPVFDVPQTPEGRTRYCLPEQAEQIIAASPHLQPLLTVLPMYRHADVRSPLS
jgi:hypothetical protein